MPKTNSRGGRNSNPNGRNQHSDWGVMDMVREHPFATTAAAGAVGALAAGAILWSRRDQVRDQFSHLIENFGSGNEEPELAEAVSSRSTPRGAPETGGGNVSLGRRNGGGGIRSTASGRGRAQSTAATQQ